MVIKLVGFVANFKFLPFCPGISMCEMREEGTAFLMASMKKESITDFQ